MPPAEYQFPVSPAQARLLVLDRMHSGSAQYHVPAAFAVHGRFDVDAFIRALDTLVARHESLRTVFRAEGGEYVQVVTEDARADVRLVPDVPPGEVGSAMLAEAQRPFDIEKGPLLRCVVYAVSDGSHRIQLTVHHLVCDGWSMQIMLRELGAAYRGEPLEPLSIQFPDCAAWQREQLAGGSHAEAVAYWRELLRDAPTTLELPGDRPRPAVQSTAGGVERLVLPAGTRWRLSRLAQDRDTTTFAVLFAAFHAFLSRISGQTDLVVGIPVSGRDHADLQDMVGMLTNTLALRTDVSGEPSFAELVDRVRDGLRAARPYQDAPFGAVVDAVAPERQLSHDPIVQVVFGYDDDTEMALDLAGARVERIELVLGVAKFDFLMYVERWGSGLHALFFYRTDLLDPATVRRWVRAFEVMLDGLLDRPDRPITAVDLLDAGERHRIVRECNRTEVATPDRLVPELVADRAAERPDAIALVCGETVLTYRQLIDRADRLAATMRAAGVGPDVPVGLCLPRSAAMAVAALAVLRAGGAYLPLDPDQPAARLGHMVADAGTRLVLADATTAERAAGTGVPVAVLAHDAADVAVSPVPVGRRVAGEPGPGSSAYLLFTSGSTGTPKAVAVPHRALTNLATAVRAQFPVTSQDRVLQYVAFSFDVAVSDLFFTWVAGAELHIAGDDERIGEALYDRLRDSRITYAFLPPSAAMSLPCPAGALPDLRTLAIGGEAVPAELVDRWAASGRRLLDAYGPSEATVYATTAVLRAGEPVVIGRPVANGRAYLLDRRLRPVPVGVVGEVYLAGANLGRGYVNRPALTAERFTADPFGPPGARMYRTGDLGRYDANGVLSYLGRVDTQVKVRGFRVELGEIETVLASHPEVAVAAATVRGDGEDRRLVAYVVGANGRPPAAGDLRAWLADRLPGYMVPETVVPLDELPVGRTGKVDRARLPDPPTTRPELAQPFVAATTATERRLAEVWARVLDLDRVGVHDNFFELGGNSIRLVTVLSELHGQGDQGLTMIDLFRHANVAALAARLDRTADGIADGIADGTAAPSADLDESRQRGEFRRARLSARAEAEKGGGR